MKEKTLTAATLTLVALARVGFNLSRGSAEKDADAASLKALRAAMGGGAKGPGSGGPRGGMFEELRLTDDQRAQMQKGMKEMQERMKGLSGNKDPRRSEPPWTSSGRR